MTLEGKMLTSKVSPHQKLASLSLPEPRDYSLSDARWSQHRKRIGLQRRTSSQQGSMMIARQTKEQYLQAFVESKLSRKECTHFVPKMPKKPGDKNAKIVCHCGEVPEKHIKNVAGVAEFFNKGLDTAFNDLTSGKPSDVWSDEECIREFPSDAFGKLDFVREGLGGRKPVKYVRLADNTDIDTVVELLLNHWHLDHPHHANLVITVIGGAKNFHLDGKKKDIFNRGLINAARTTHAWIITSGFNMGVMKAVGEAVQEGQSYNWDKYGMTHSLRCIGIAPWGYVEAKNCLVSSSGEGCWNARYKVNNIIRHHHPVSLNPDHTHFLLVDDGHRLRYGGVADFRARLEKKIAQPATTESGQESGLGIPVVLLVVEGGVDAIVDTSRSLKQQIPVVLCEGTGRAADILAYAYTHHVTTTDGERSMKEKHKSFLMEKLKVAYGKTWAERSDIQKETEKYLAIVLECCADEGLITVFDMNKQEGLDSAILSALLKGRGASNLDQLKLALTWDRSDIAEEKIFSQNIDWPRGQLDIVMTDALVDNKVDFVRLLLQSGLVMREYLTPAILTTLYNKAPKVSQLRQLLHEKTNRHVFTLEDVDALLYRLTGWKRQWLDDQSTPDGDVERDEAVTDTRESRFNTPCLELFLWAVLMNRQALALFLWERTDEAISSAIAATKIYSWLEAKVEHHDLDLRNSYLQHKMEFEKKAVKVLDECHNTDPEKSALLIERKYPTWGNFTCLEMAAASHDRELLSTVCCQNSLNMMWKRGVSSSYPMMLASLFFPVLIFTRIRFQQMGDSQITLGPWQKVLTFFTAPATKFMGHVIMYLIFLCLYSYVILFDFRPDITVREWVVIGWLGTMLIEEVREMLFSSKANSLHLRLLDWWEFSPFNKLDAIILICGLVGFSLRFSTDTFIAAKTIYCINCVCLFIRVLSFYTASSYLGPKLVMITTMMQELLLYLMILVVFLLAYGISSQAMMYPIRSFYQAIFKDIFYYPYWQIYGELYLEELEGRTDDCLAVNSTFRSDGSMCPQFSWLVPALTAAYLLVGNVLLLNILIAIFNHVFVEIQANSIQIWKYAMYFLVVEYDTKPVLAPPFSILEHVYLSVRLVIAKCCCQHSPSAEEDLLQKQQTILQIFEKECCKQHMQKQRLSERKDLHKKVEYIQTRVDETCKLLDEWHQEQQHSEGHHGHHHTAGKGHSHSPHHSPHHTSNSHRDNITANLTAGHGMATTSTHNNQSYEQKKSNISQPLKQKIRKKYSRWPSLDSLRRLKLQVIEESPVQSGDNSAESSRPQSSCSSSTIIGQSQRHDSSTGSSFITNSTHRQDSCTSGSVTSHRPDNTTVYDELEFDRMRTLREQNDYGDIAAVKAWAQTTERRRHQTDPSVGNQYVDDEVESKLSKKKKSTKNKKGKGSRQSMTPSGSMERDYYDNDNQRTGELEQRLVHLERMTAGSLYNIEALLRSSVYNRGAVVNVQPPPLPTRGGAVPSRVGVVPTAHRPAMPDINPPPLPHSRSYYPGGDDPFA